MTTMDKEIAQARSAVGVAAWRHDPEAEKIARERLLEVKLSRDIRLAMEATPPLTPAARDRLVLLLLEGALEKNGTA